MTNKKKHKRIKIKMILIFFSLSFLTIGCDCITTGNGIVYDNNSNLPLDSVVVKSYEQGKDTSKYLTDQKLTDTTGHFFGSTGVSGTCKKLIIILSKKDYYSDTLINPKDEKVKLKRK